MNALIGVAVEPVFLIADPIADLMKRALVMTTTAIHELGLEVKDGAVDGEMAGCSERQREGG